MMEGLAEAEVDGVEEAAVERGTLMEVEVEVPAVESRVEEVSGIRMCEV